MVFLSGLLLPEDSALWHIPRHPGFWFLSLYPELNPFYEKLSAWLGVQSKQIYVTEGVSGAVKSVIEVLDIQKGHKIIFPFPTFAMYPVYCDMFDIKNREIQITAQLFPLIFNALKKNVFNASSCEERGIGL